MSHYAILHPISNSFQNFRHRQLCNALPVVEPAFLYRIVVAKRNPEDWNSNTQTKFLFMSEASLEVEILASDQLSGF